MRLMIKVRHFKQLRHPTLPWASNCDLKFRGQPFFRQNLQKCSCTQPKDAYYNSISSSIINFWRHKMKFQHIFKNQFDLNSLQVEIEEVFALTFTGTILSAAFIAEMVPFFWQPHLQVMWSGHSRCCCRRSARPRNYIKDTTLSYFRSRIYLNFHEFAKIFTNFRN